MIHPRLRDALSPQSHFYYVLWPIIVEQADWQTRANLLVVNRELHKLCRPFRRSDRAKRHYSRRARNLTQLHPFYPIKLSMAEEWLCFSVSRCRFSTVDSFRLFCDLGDINPLSSKRWCKNKSQVLFRQQLRRDTIARFAFGKAREAAELSLDSASRATRRAQQMEIQVLEDEAAVLRNSWSSWRSRSGDIVMDSQSTPMAADGSFHYVFADLGVTGSRDRVRAMFNYLRDNHIGSRRVAEDEDELGEDAVEKEKEEKEGRQDDDGGLDAPSRQDTRDDHYGVYWRRVSWDRGYF